MVKTKSVYDAVEESDGKRILVTRYWPRGFKRESLAIVEWCRTVAPSRKLLRDWRDGKTSWPEYEERYFEEMHQQEEELGKLAEMASSGAVTLLCFEPEEDPHCHRYLLKGLIEQRMPGVPQQHPHHRLHRHGRQGDCEEPEGPADQGSRDGGAGEEQRAGQYPRHRAHPFSRQADRRGTTLRLCPMGASFSAHGFELSNANELDRTQGTARNFIFTRGAAPSCDNAWRKILSSTRQCH